MNDSLEDLVEHWLNGSLSDEQFSRLQDLLKDSPEARAQFLRVANLDSGLRDLASVPASFDAVVPFPASKPVARSRTFWAVAAGIVVGAAVLWLVQRGAIEGGEPGFATLANDPVEQVAVVTGEAGAVWEQPEGTILGEGGALGPGRLILSRGLAQIDFFGGASISLSAPAEIELVSRDRAILHKGSLKADVPPAARGFEIRTAEVVLEDLGTSFGLAVFEDSRADLVVFDGEVRAIEKSGESRLVHGGESVRLDRGTAVPLEVASEGSFPDISEVFAEVGDEADSRFAAWTEASLDLRRDPRLIAYYDFENLTLESRRLRNRAAVGDGSELDGGIVGARVAEGRWPGKTALDFRRVGDRVRFQIPGEFDEMTLFAWVRIDALDRHLSSLFLTDFFDPNEIHWQISNRGALHFATSPMGVEDLPKHNRRFYSEPFWDPTMSGRWFFLATTVDRNTNGISGKSVTHFINGEPVGFSGGTNMNKPLPRMRIGEADLGNWSEPIWPDVAIRTLNGRIDEFAIFREALSPEEIRSLFEIGKP